MISEKSKAQCSNNVLLTKKLSSLLDVQTIIVFIGSCDFGGMNLYKAQLGGLFAHLLF